MQLRPSRGGFLRPFGCGWFIREVTGRLTIGQGINVQLLGWPWLSALDENDPIALVKRDGTQRLAYGVWLSLFSNLK